MKVTPKTGVFMKAVEFLITTGRALIFNHDAPHSGDYIQYGEKYIIRAEVMFKCSNMGYEVDPKAYMRDPLYLKAKKLYEISENYQQQSNLDKALEAYLEVDINY